MFHRLLLAHLVADFVLQNRWLVRRKHTPGGLATHAAVVALAMFPVGWGDLATWWPGLLFITVAHAAIDWAKIRLTPYLRLPPILPFLVDQVAHLLTIAAVAALVEGGQGLAGPQVEPGWWIASIYLIATFALSIALPLWLDPASLMRRPPAARLLLIVASALVLTLAWSGYPLWIPVAGLAFYQLAARRQSRNPASPTFAVEFWTAMLVAASLGWLLA